MKWGKWENYTITIGLLKYSRSTIATDIQFVREEFPFSVVQLRKKRKKLCEMLQFSEDRTQSPCTRWFDKSLSSPLALFTRDENPWNDENMQERTKENVILEESVFNGSFFFILNLVASYQRLNSANSFSSTSNLYRKFSKPRKLMNPHSVGEWKFRRSQYLKFAWI